MSEPVYSSHRPHPWHGLEPGERAPDQVTVFVEMTPVDLVKYELDKSTGFLCVDRPQRTTSRLPCLYGFIPQTYCAEAVAGLSPESLRGDGDPLDICVLSERSVTRAEITLNARVLGGLQMIDGGEADDKIIAVLVGDLVWGQARELSDLPDITIERLQHYFLTYKMAPDTDHHVSRCEPYGKQHAFDVINASLADYESHFGAPSLRRDS